MIRAKIEKAIVTLTKKGGQGVLVAGNLVLTAAHCIDFSCEGEMVLQDQPDERFIEEIETALGKFKVTPLAVEPLSDIAILGALNGYSFPDEEEQFEAFCRFTAPVPICTDNFEPFQEFPAYVHTHERVWIEARAQLTKPEGRTIRIEADEQLKRGTSGGPVINSSGELLGVASHSNIITESLSKCSGRIPRPHLTLPVWVWQEISTAEEFDEVVGVVTLEGEVVCAGCVKDWHDVVSRFHGRISRSNTEGRGTVYICSQCEKTL